MKAHVVLDVACEIGGGEPTPADLRDAVHSMVAHKLFMMSPNPACVDLGKGGKVMVTITKVATKTVTGRAFRRGEPKQKRRSPSVKQS